ncbi:hypothetical protein ASG90_17345 [Nocardioides sp. Soil797]|nr:hypothetical protein ASG90_17345 [Nocardioides sp. Soil797]
MRSIVRRSASHALSALAVVGVLCIVVTLAGLLFDVRALVFKSGSMSPAIDTGALAFTRPVDARDLEVGDIVSIPVKDSRVTHRIEDITLDGDRATLVLKGDANTMPDAEPYQVDSADRVFLDVPSLGYVVTWFSGRFGIFLGGMLAAGLLYLMFRPTAGGKERDASARGGRRSHHAARHIPIMAMAITLVTATTLGASGLRFEPTWAAWTDSSSATGGKFQTHYVVRPDAVSCTNGAPVLLGYFDSVKLGITHKSSLYDYVLRVYDSNNVQRGNDIAVPSGSAVVGSTVTSTVSANQLAGLLPLGGSVTVRAFSRLKSGPTWESSSFRQWRIDTGLLGILLLNGVKCGVETTGASDTAGPTIAFMMPFDGRPTSGVVSLQSDVRNACGGVGDFGCGTVSDASGVQTVEYMLKRAGNTTGTKCFNRNVFVDVCEFIEEDNISGTTWKLDDALASTAYFFDGTFTLTIRAVDNLGNVSVRSATFTTT